ncbi:hypothetical protein BOX15_Mlig034205g1, partial [Macrostomum lignano]
WSKDGTPLTDSDRFQMVANGGQFTLSIPVALSTDSGCYQLVAELNGAKETAAFALQILPGEDVNQKDLQSILDQHSE